MLQTAGGSIAAVFTRNESIHDWSRNASVESFDTNEIEAETRTLQFDYLLSIANFAIIEDAVLSRASIGCVNFHDGPLPEYAGLNTPAWAIIAGEKKWAITWHVMDAGIDTGRIVHRHPIEIAENETSFSLNTKCYGAAIDSFPTVLENISNPSFKPSAQEEKPRVYCAKSKRPEFNGLLDFQKTAGEIDQLVRALDFGNYDNPLAVPKIFAGDSLYQVTSARILPRHSSETPGTVLSTGPVVISTASNDIELGLSKFNANQPEEPTAPSLPVGLVIQPPDEICTTAVLKQLVKSAKSEPALIRLLREPVPATLPHWSGRDAINRSGTTITSNLGAIPTDQAVALIISYLSRLTGQSSIDVATTYPGHPLFGNTIPHRFAIDESQPLEKSLKRIAKTLNTAQPVTADFQARYPTLHLRTNIVVGTEKPDAPIDADLFVCVPQDGSVEWVSNGTLKPRDLERMAKDLTRLEAFDAGTPLKDFPLVQQEAQDELLERWSGPDAEFDQSLRVEEIIDEVTDVNPDGIALRCANRVVTYGQLKSESDAVALGLSAVLDETDEWVGVHMHRGSDMVIALLGIMKSGRAYVPLDPSFPAERLRHMVEDSGLSLAICSSSTPVKGLSVSTTTLQKLRTMPPSNPRASKSDLAYMIYTSGSTGRPKGVRVTHSNVVNFFQAMDLTVPVEPGKRWCAVTSLSFDISVLELLWTLTRQLEVVVFSGESIELHNPAEDPGNPKQKLDFSLFYFSSYTAGQTGSKQYRVLLDGARYADANGFLAVWTPERHFHEFGGLYPNPATTSAALATITNNVRLRAGSCVSPLHHVLRLTEEWSVVDNLSDGRVDISFAAGWQPNDFVLQPQNYADRKEIMFAQIEDVQKLWAGETMSFADAQGKEVELSIRPQPVQRELDVWITAASNPETFEMAGVKGYNILTHLLGQTTQDLAAKIEIYRNARESAGLDPTTGKVTLMLHTFVGEDRDKVKETVRGPMKDYLRSSLGLIKAAAWQFPTFKQKTTDAEGKFSMDQLSPEDAETILDYSFDRYFETSGLFGTVDECCATARAISESGVDEIACLIDFGIDVDTVLSHLPQLKQVKDTFTADSGALTSLASTILDTKADYLQCTPSLARMLLADADGNKALQSLNRLLVGGEALPSSLASELREHCAEISNMYGPTETTIWSSVMDVQELGGTSTVPIGKPVANTQFYILDDQKRLLPPGIPGTLHIGGAGVTGGYHKRDVLNRERFTSIDGLANGRVYNTGDLVVADDDGVFHFLGREDFQVKIRGYRIELGDIESALTRHTSVKSAVITASSPELATLIAYFIPEGEVNIDHGHLQTHLADLLPEYMVPSKFIQVHEFPLTPNKKIDRAALAKLQDGRGRSDARQGSVSKSSEPTPSMISTSGDVEGIIRSIWIDLLQTDAVGLDDNFFDIGGHSLLAVQVNARLQEQISSQISLIDLFRFPTIRSLANHLASQGGANVEDSKATSTGSSRAAKRKRARLRRH